jgi:hypothetical protein
MEWLWTWGGRCFGYREGNNLWTHDGKHVGYFDGDDIYGQDGRYLGELVNGRLITNRSRGAWIRGSFAPYASRAGFAKYADYAGYAMLAGYEDFPHLER